MDIKNHETFCLYPFLHRLIDTNGFVRLCCRDHGVPIGHVSGMNADWNNARMQSIRQRLSGGEKIKACTECWKQEELGKTSERQDFNRFWAEQPGVQKLIDRAIENDMVVDEPPRYIEVRFGNLCNLTCKMCIGHSSTQVMKDAAKLKQLDPISYERYIKREDSFVGQDYQWYQNSTNWDQVDQIIPHLEAITITGGEPTLIKKNMEFLQRCIDLGVAKDIKVDITTNLTNINDDFLLLMSEFKTFHISFSLDGYGDHYEYIRYPANWSKIESNMRKVLAKTYEHDNIFVAIHMVVQAFNILYLSDIIDTIFGILSEECKNPESRVTAFSLTSITSPKIFNIPELPDIVKAVAKHRMTNWIEQNQWSTGMLDLIPNGTIDMLMNQLEQPEGFNRAKTILDYCRFLDQNKRVNLQQKIPELAQLLNASLR